MDVMEEEGNRNHVGEHVHGWAEHGSVFVCIWLSWVCLVLYSSRLFWHVVVVVVVVVGGQETKGGARAKFSE